MGLNNATLLNRLTAIARARGEKLTVRKMGVGWRVGFGTDIAGLAAGRTLQEAALAALREEVLRRHAERREARVDAG
jgi:hypothetical protein